MFMAVRTFGKTHNKELAAAIQYARQQLKTNSGEETDRSKVLIEAEKELSQYENL